MGVKGCAFLALLFLTGIGLVVSGFIYEVMVAGVTYQDAVPGGATERLPEKVRLARILEVSGVVVAFAAIFGGAGWAFYRRQRDGESPSDDPG